MATNGPLSPEVLSYYARENRTRISDMEKDQEKMRVALARIEEKLDRCGQRVDEVAEAIKASRRLMTTLIVSIATGAVGFAFTVLLAVGKL